MARKSTHTSGRDAIGGVDASAFWRLARRQHGVVTRSQLLELGLSGSAIDHRLRRGRLHRLHRGVFAVGRPDLDRHGQWLAAVLALGPDALLSHQSAAELWEIRPLRTGIIEVSIPSRIRRVVRGVSVHRRRGFDPRDGRARLGIPVTGPVRTLTDIATQLTAGQLEAAVNEADKRDLVDPERLRVALEDIRGQPGVPALRRLLDRRTFVLTDSDLERRFLRLVRAAGLSKPATGQQLNGFRVDFFWPDLGLVVETDGLRYHRTPAQQARDRVRDQTHAVAGLTTLRFTHSQVRFQHEYVRDTLHRVATRLSSAARRSPPSGRLG